MLCRSAPSRWAPEDSLGIRRCHEHRGTDNPDKERFEILADGELAGFVQYHLRGDEIAFTHTQTDDRFRGLGIASRLVQSSLNAGRERHLTVLPYCPFGGTGSPVPRVRQPGPADRRQQFGL